MPGQTLYIAILKKTNFDGFYSRLFLYPDEWNPVDPAWFYLNTIDFTGCLDRVIKFDELFDPVQREKLLATDLFNTLIVQCSWCNKFKSLDSEGTKWLTLEEKDWAPIRTAITHGICPECIKDWIRS